MKSFNFFTHAALAAFAALSLSGCLGAGIGGGLGAAGMGQAAATSAGVGAGSAVIDAVVGPARAAARNAGSQTGRAMRKQMCAWGYESFCGEVATPQAPAPGIESARAACLAQAERPEECASIGRDVAGTE